MSPETSILDYFKDLSDNGHSEVKVRPPSLPTDQFAQITVEEISLAIRNTGHKATGVDGLNSIIVKSKNLNRTVLTKIALKFNEWLFDS